MMELNPMRDLYSCLYSFVPFVLSIPFLFVYSLDRLSLWLCLVLVPLLFVAHFLVFRRFYSEPVFIRAHFLILTMTLGLIWSFSSTAIGLFTVTLSIFHLSEYISVGLWCPRNLALNSFLLNHSPSYHAAIVLAYVEYFLEKFYFFPRGIPLQWLSIVLGLVMVIGGEYLRKLAMYTAQQSFSHLIEDKPNQEHRLITHGIYGYYRHPSYVGWFWWACGTQVLLANPVCLILYIVSTWMFFSERIAYEEATLVRFYGGLYRGYQQRVPVGIPFIRGHV